MTELFADTFYFLALRNPRDSAHAWALALTPQLRSRRLVTTAWVLTEVADALADPSNRGGFPLLLRVLNASQAVILSPEQTLFDRGIAYYNQRPDKEWTLTDCISFVVMSDRKIEEALTGDHHFLQAGFRVLYP